MIVRPPLDASLCGGRGRAGTRALEDRPHPGRRDRPRPAARLQDQRRDGRRVRRRRARAEEVRQVVGVLRRVGHEERRVAAVGRRHVRLAPDLRLREPVARRVEQDRQVAADRGEGLGQRRPERVVGGDGARARAVGWPKIARRERLDVLVYCRSPSSWNRSCVAVPGSVLPFEITICSGPPPSKPAISNGLPENWLRSEIENRKFPPGSKNSALRSVLVRDFAWTSLMSNVKSPRSPLKPEHLERVGAGLRQRLEHGLRARAGVDLLQDVPSGSISVRM